MAGRQSPQTRLTQLQDQEEIILDEVDYDGSNYELLDPFPYDEETLMYLIQGTKQPGCFNVKMVKTDDDDNDDEEKAEQDNGEG